MLDVLADELRRHLQGVTSRAERPKFDGFDKHGHASQSVHCIRFVSNVLLI
jgi:hypothetical protein